MSPELIDRYLVVMDQVAKYEEAQAALARHRAEREAASKTRR